MPLPFNLVNGIESKTIVLTYHDIIERRGSDSVWFDTTVEEFRSQIDWLEKRGAVFIDLDQLYSHLAEKKPVPSRAVALTFADNYYGFFQFALPILREKEIPAAMFVHTAFVGSPVGRPKMDWHHLRKLRNEGLVTIGSQTVSHPADLSKLPRRQIERELVDSKEKLERELGGAVHYLAYPNGKFSATCSTIAHRAGYRMAFSEKQTPAEESPNLYAVARYVHTKLQQAWKDAGRSAP